MSQGKTRIGWIGLGVMGRSMCTHVMDHGFSMTVFTRTRATAASVLEKGALWAASPKAVAEQSDVVFSIVGFPHDVREVILGENGALAGCRPGNVLVDMTTSEPSLAVEIYEAARARGVASVDAPVSGGDVGARKALLSIMIGGDEEDVEALGPCWRAMGKAIVRQGGPGAGQHAKMVNQVLIASGMIGMCEGLLYAYRSGLDLETVMKSVAPGAAGSWSLSNYGPPRDRQRLRPRLLRRALRQGHGDRPRRGEPHEAGRCRGWRWRTSCIRRYAPRGRVAGEPTLSSSRWLIYPTSTGWGGD